MKLNLSFSRTSAKFHWTFVVNVPHHNDEGKFLFLSINAIEMTNFYFTDLIFVLK